MAETNPKDKEVIEETDLSNKETSEKLNADDADLSWFWRVSTRWHFFPVLYLILTLILTIFDIFLKIFRGAKELSIIKSFFLLLISMPSGLLYSYSLILYFYSLIMGNQIATDAFPEVMAISVLFFVFFIISIKVLHDLKRKYNIVIKWLIIVLIILLILSFSGCALGLYTSSQIKF